MTIQEVKIKYKPSVSLETIQNDFKIFMENYLSNREGLINRFCFKNSENIWVMYIIYNTKEDALKSITDYQLWEGSHNILNNLEEGGLIFHHHEMGEPLLMQCK